MPQNSLRRPPVPNQEWKQRPRRPRESGIERRGLTCSIAGNGTAIPKVSTPRIPTVLPTKSGCYEGRWPHIHFEVFSSNKVISDATTNVLTSQIALPEEAAQEAYKDSHYVDSADNLAGVSLSSDMVFSYGWDMQLPAMTGDASRGYTCSIDVRGGSRLQGRCGRSAKKNCFLCNLWELPWSTRR